jgi:hypothetical protein
VTADRRTWAWRQSIPPEEKLTLLAAIEVGDRLTAAEMRPDTLTLPERVEEVGALTGAGTLGTNVLVKRLQVRGLIDADGCVPEGEQLAI